jgi:hypothetical protein
MRMALFAEVDRSRSEVQFRSAPTLCDRVNGANGIVRAFAPAAVEIVTLLA